MSCLEIKGVNITVLQKHLMFCHLHRCRNDLQKQEYEEINEVTYNYKKSEEESVTLFRPFTMMVSGPTGCGKTTYLMKRLLSPRFMHAISSTNQMVIQTMATSVLGNTPNCYP